jgi:hypothetical protein
LRALALEIQNRYDLMLKLDLDPEDADLHRELLDLASRNRGRAPARVPSTSRAASARLPVHH